MVVDFHEVFVVTWAISLKVIFTSIAVIARNDIDFVLVDLTIIDNIQETIDIFLIIRQPTLNFSN